jgi:hypothetical protein
MATNVPNPGTYLASIGTWLTGLRDDFGHLEQQRTYIATMGGLTFLTASPPDGLGLSSGDATALIAVLDQHHDLATAYADGPPAPQLDYRGNASKFWGGN